MSDRFQYLSIKYLDGSLTQAETSEFLNLVKGNLEYQKELAEMLVQDAAIQNVLGAQSQVEKEIKLSGNLRPIKTNPKHKSRRFQVNKKQSPWPMLAIAALVFLGIAIPGFLYKKSLDSESNKSSGLNGQVNVSNNVKAMAQVVSIYGPVYKVQNGTKEKITKGTSISLGDTLESENNGFVKLETNKKSLIYINQDSRFYWNEKNIELQKGSIFAEINKMDIASVYQFITPDNCRINITGTSFELGYFENDTILKVKEGKVEFYKANVKKTIVKNQMISKREFEKGAKTVKPESIAAWLDKFKGGFVYFDEFDTETYDYFWTLKTSQDSFKKSPKDGLFCEGKGQRTELVSKDIVLDGKNSMNLIFKSKHINAFNSFEYGYEIWNDNKILVKQGYAVEQIDLNSYHIKETRNFGDSNDQLNMIKTKNENIPDVSYAIPDISFSVTLNPSDELEPAKVDYKKGNTMSDITVGSKLNVFRIVFYIYTVNNSSKVEWKFRGFAFGYGNSEVDSVHSEKILKWNQKPNR